MQLVTVLPIDLNKEIKHWLRVEHDADDAIIEMLLLSAYEEADTFLNRQFPAGAPELLNIKRALLQTIAYWYENRGEVGKLPAQAQETLLQYRFEPGF